MNDTGRTASHYDQTTAASAEYSASELGANGFFYLRRFLVKIARHLPRPRSEFRWSILRRLMASVDGGNHEYSWVSEPRLLRSHMCGWNGYVGTVVGRHEYHRATAAILLCRRRIGVAWFDGIVSSLKNLNSSGGCASNRLGDIAASDAAGAVVSGSERDPASNGASGVAKATFVICRMSRLAARLLARSGFDARSRQQSIFVCFKKSCSGRIFKISFGHQMPRFGQLVLGFPRNENGTGNLCGCQSHSTGYC